MTEKTTITASPDQITLYRSFCIPFRYIERSKGSDFHIPDLANSYGGSFVSTTREYAAEYGKECGTVNELSIPILNTYILSTEDFKKAQLPLYNDPSEFSEEGFAGGKNYKLDPKALSNPDNVEVLLKGQWIPYNKQVVLDNKEYYMDEEIQEILPGDGPIHFASIVLREARMTEKKIIKTLNKIQTARTIIKKIAEPHPDVSHKHEEATSYNLMVMIQDYFGDSKEAVEFQQQIGWAAYMKGLLESEPERFEEEPEFWDEARFENELNEGIRGLKSLSSDPNSSQLDQLLMQYIEAERKRAFKETDLETDPITYTFDEDGTPKLARNIFSKKKKCCCGKTDCPCIKAGTPCSSTCKCMSKDKKKQAVSSLLLEIRAARYQLYKIAKKDKKESKKPKKVKEIADAIRRDNKGISDGVAYAQAWETYCSYVNPKYEGCTSKGKSKRKSPKKDY